MLNGETVEPGFEVRNKWDSHSSKKPRAPTEKCSIFQVSHSILPKLSRRETVVPTLLMRKLKHREVTCPKSYCWQVIELGLESCLYCASRKKILDTRRLESVETGR